MTMLLPTESSDRYARQENVYPATVRAASGLAVLGADADPQTARWLLAGAAAMGVPVVASDYEGTHASHWLLGQYPDMVRTINGDVQYKYLNPDEPATDLQRLAAERSNAWAAVLLTDPAHARDAVAKLAQAGIGVRVLLVLAAPGGVVVDRCAGPAQAISRLQGANGASIPLGAPELGSLAAGLALNEVMLGDARPDDLSLPRTVGFYSLRRPRRVAEPVNGITELLGEVAAESGLRASFAGRNFVMVGAGALGCWIGPLLAMENPAGFRIVDGDAIEASNLNRQIPYVRSPVGALKAEALARELRGLNSSGRFEACVQFVKEPAEIEVRGADAIIAGPDNDQARFVVGDAAAEVGVMYATAGSSPYGGQAIVCRPGGTCFRCLTGAEAQSSGAEPPDADRESCLAGDNDAVVASNMVAASLLVSELREACSGRPHANVRFVGNNGTGNRLVRMITNVPSCPHASSRPIDRGGARCRH